MAGLDDLISQALESKTQPQVESTSPLDTLIQQTITQRNLASGNSSGLLVTTPVPKTGDFAVDNRGKPRPRTGGILGVSGEEITRQVTGAPVAQRDLFPDEFDFDSREQIMLDNAEAGVDSRRGLPFLKRASLAATSLIPEAQSIITRQVLNKEIEKVPEGIDPLRFDTALDQWQIATQITAEDITGGFEAAESLGKFRYRTLEGAGVEMSDIADLMNPGEILAFAGSLAGPTSKSKYLTLGRTTAKGRAAAGSFSLASLGRISGDALSVMMDVYRSDGEFIPTATDLAKMGMNDVAIEGFATLIGEGLIKGVGKTSEFAQAAFARMTGREAIHGSEEAVLAANVNLVRAKKDIDRITGATGKEFSVSRGEATGSIDQVELAQSRRKNASPARKRQLELEDAKNNKITQDFIDNAFEGSLNVFKNRHGTVLRANRAMQNSNVLVTQTDGNVMTFNPKVDPNQGLVVRDLGSGNWQVGHIELSPEFRGQNFGSDLYRVAAQEARANGAVLNSSGSLKPDAYDTWKRLEREGGDGFDNLVWNPKAEFNETLNRWETPNLEDGPVVSMVLPPAVLPTILSKDLQGASFLASAQARDGRVKVAKEFGEMIRGSQSRSVLGQVREEIDRNVFWKQNLLEELFQDYKRSVVDPKTGKFSRFAFEDWKAQTGGFTEKMFTPQELVRIQKRGGLREVVEEGAEKATQLALNLERTLKLPTDTFKFKNPEATSIFKQLKKLEPNRRRRAMALLDAGEGGLGNSIRELLSNDIKVILKKTMAPKAGSETKIIALTEWIKENRELISDVYTNPIPFAAAGNPNAVTTRGKQYLRDLSILGRIQERKAIRAGAVGTREEANPTLLAVTRVAFGPLSRKQRFLSAARRIQTRGMGEAAIEMVADPDKLALYMRLKELPLTSAQLPRVLAQLGLSDLWPGRDLEDPLVREQIAEEMKATLIAEEEAIE